MTPLQIQQETARFGQREARIIPSELTKIFANSYHWLLRRLPKRASQQAFEHRSRFRTPMFCPWDLRDREACETVLNQYHLMLGKVIGCWAEYFLMRQFVAQAKNKVIAGRGDVYGSERFPAVAPDSILAAPLLALWRQRLCQEGGEVVVQAPRNEDGGPVLDLLCDSATSELLLPFDPLGNGPTRAGRRSDGFQHLLEGFLPRMDLVNGEWIDIEPFVIEQTDAGVTAQFRTEYLRAPFQDSLVVLAGTAEILTELSEQHAPIVNPGLLGKEWSVIFPCSWFSEAGVQGCNLDGTNGFWWLDVGMSFYAIQPEKMVVIRHRRPVLGTNPFF